MNGQSSAVKIYKVSILSKYYEIVTNYIVDCLVLFIFPYVLLPGKPRPDVTFVGAILVAILYFKVDRTYFPFILEIHNDRVRLRYFKNLFFSTIFYV